MNKFAAFLALTFLGGNVFGADNPARPNIVFLLADDLGIDGVGCYGSDRFKDKTPNIDALAKSGIRFERCYSTPLCGPSRCQIMTGRYGFRTGGFSNPAAHNPSYKAEPSLAKALKHAGYTTGMAGKWRQMGQSPGDWGFDEYLTDNAASGWYWQNNFIQNGKTIHKHQAVYGPDLCLDFAKDFFNRHRDVPFYFYYPTHLVHGPMLRTPDTKTGITDREALYNANVAYMDKQIGLLVGELERLGLRERTLILFSIDNGTAQRSLTIDGREINGHKGTMQEGGVRVPLIASWKGVTPEGKVLPDLIDFSDFFPTFVELAGGTMPKHFKFDGRSFAPQLRGEKGTPREWVFVQLGRNWYVRNDGWKLNQGGELFDMSDSPFVENLVPSNDKSPDSTTAHTKLQAVLDELNPEGGKLPPKHGQNEKTKKRKRHAATATDA